MGSNVRGIDEYVPCPMYMPSRDASSNAVLSFWSLNHAIETPRGDRGSGARAATVHLVGGSCGCRVNVPAPGSTVIVKRPMKSTPRKPSTVMGGFPLTMTGSS